MRAFLDLPDGMAIRIGSAGLLLGRHRSCDVQLAAESASRRHALLRLGDDGVEMIVLGQQPIEVDGTSIATSCTLVSGARLDLPGLVCTVRIEDDSDAVADDFAVRYGNGSFPIRTSPFVIGGGAAAIVVDGWPAKAIELHVAQATLCATLAEPGLHNASPLAAATLVELAPGDTLELRGRLFSVERVRAGDATTVAASDSRIHGAVLAPLPRGGRITFCFADGERTVYLPGRRYRLAATLLSPPPPFVVGEFVPDATLVPLVWNDTREGGAREDINVLLTRLRRDLVTGNIAAAAILERAPGGRATRFIVAPGASVREID
jgi:hypothetical protein